MDIMIVSCQEFDAKVYICSKDGEKDRMEILPSEEKIIIKGIVEEEISIRFEGKDEIKNPILSSFVSLLYYGFLIFAGENLEEYLEKEGFWDVDSNFIITVVKQGEQCQNQVLNMRYENAPILQDCKACFNLGTISGDLDENISFRYKMEQKKFWKMLHQTCLSIIIWTLILCVGTSFLAYKIVGISGVGLMTIVLFLPIYCIVGTFIGQKNYWNSQISNME